MNRQPVLEVHFTSDDLLLATHAERESMLKTIIQGLAYGDTVAGNTAYWLGKETSQDYETTPNPGTQVTETAHGHMSVDDTLGFLLGTERLRGFTRAIKHWDAPENIIDVGCGPFPILALAAAFYHPKAEIAAVEINPSAAEAAKEIVERFGLSDRLHVIETDIANHAIGSNTDTAITETFNAGLVFEPGPKIVRMLSEAGVSTITPSHAKLRLEIGNTAFHDWVDLRTDTHGHITFANPNGHPLAHLSAAYYDTHGVVLDYNRDIISEPIPVGGPYSEIGEIPTTDKAQITYELGEDDFNPSLATLSNTRTVTNC